MFNWRNTTCFTQNCCLIRIELKVCWWIKQFICKDRKISSVQKCIYNFLSQENDAWKKKIKHAH